MTSTHADRSLYPDAFEEFRGRAVWELGEDGDMGVVVQGHDLGAHMALVAFCLNRGMDPPSRFPAPGERPVAGWATFRESCGCTDEQHAEHVAAAGPDWRAECELTSGTGDCAVLPPCNPEQFAWLLSRHHGPTYPDAAVPVLTWGY